MTEANNLPAESSLSHQETAQTKKDSDRWAKIVIILFLPVFAVLVASFLLMVRYLDSGSLSSLPSNNYALPTSMPTTVTVYIPNAAIQPSVDYGGSVSGGDTSWFSGGTLHKSKIREWRAASYANRLATAADFIAATQNVDYGDLVAFKKMATDLEICISTAAEGGAADNEQTTFISAICLVEMYPK